MGEGQASSDAEEGLYRVLLEDKVETVVLGDYGSDFNAIPPRLLDEVRKELEETAGTLAITEYNGLL